MNYYQKLLGIALLAGSVAGLSGCDQAEKSAQSLLNQASETAKQAIDQGNKAAQQALNEANQALPRLQQEEKNTSEARNEETPREI
ncbi:hypothetical protein [Pseudomonas sp. nanlin1]|uniref:hypothetical protein n=1 Tax=Pseudomonas sp. nanlin1 TaxID=3040605 RepID=UPI003890DD7E